MMNREEAVKIAYRHLYPTHLTDTMPDKGTTRVLADAVQDVADTVARRCAEIAQETGRLENVATAIRREFGLTDTAGSEVKG